MKNIQLVWFKRDLRIQDHEALHYASQRGPVIPLYIFEPGLWAQPDTSERHFDFICEGLKELNRNLTELGQPLIIRTGEAVQALDALYKEYKFEVLWSHMETGNGFTHANDQRLP